MNAFFKRALSACTIFFMALPTAGSVAMAQSGVDVVGLVLDGGSGLPVANATVDLERGTQKFAETKTASDGGFRFANEPQGIYNLLIVASGYQGTRSSDLVLTNADSVVRYQVALQRTTGNQGGLKTIGYVNVGGRQSLQTTTTINKSVDPQILQSENYMRSGDALGLLPGVNTGTSSAVGDDQSVSIRGFNSSETATLLDGHPIGPIGARGGASAVGGGGFDYQDSPFFGLRNVQAVFGSGATGLYGASTIAGAVDFQTIEPSRTPHGLWTQGIGNNGKSMTGLQATGTFGKLGYALSHAVEGTYGMFYPQTIEQTGSEGTDFSSGNRAANTYTVTGNYTLRNDLLKLVYSFDPTTQLSLTGYSATSWDDKSGNGDTDYLTAPYVLYSTQNGSPDPNCPAGQITINTDSGSRCVSYAQYAAMGSGPAGGGPSPWQAIRNQDYHARFTKSAGSHTVTLDNYYDNYVVDYNRSISGGFDPTCNCFTGFFNTNFYKTNGFLAGDEFLVGKNDIGFGFYTQHQRHLYDRYNNKTHSLVWNPEYDLNQYAYYVRDQFQASSKVSLFGDLWFKHSNSSNATSFDPRFTVMFRPTTSDVVRFTAGHSNSDPDPALVYSPVTFDTNFNAITLCPNNQVNVASGGDPKLKAETATDMEAAYGHKFGNNASLQVDVYSAQEQNALFAGIIPLAQLGVMPDPAYLAQLYARLQSECHIANPTINNLTASTTYNAAGGRFRGIEVSGAVDIVHDLRLSADYDIQSAIYTGVPDYILTNNAYIINGAQIAGVPLRKANIALDYGNPGGFAARIDGHFIDTNNSYNRPAFWFANASISNNFGPVTLNLGANNLFNSAASPWGFIGYGTYTPVNSFNTANFPNALAEGSEEFGLPYRQIWFTITQRF